MVCLFKSFALFIPLTFYFKTMIDPQEVMTFPQREKSFIWECLHFTFMPERYFPWTEKSELQLFLSALVLLLSGLHGF